MKALASVLPIAQADFRERVRRSSFLVLLSATVAGAYSFVPAPSAGYVTLSFEGIRGLYNSAWVGSMVAILDIALLSLVGFYLVRDAVERDERTGVGQILATTPMTRLAYVAGKFLSHVAILGCVAAVTLAMAVVMQEVRGEVRAVEPLRLVLPFLVLVLPALLLVAALAILFETWKPLRGTVGGILYFFLWIGMLTVPIAQLVERGQLLPWLDALGWVQPVAAIQASVRAHFPDYRGGAVLGGARMSRWELRTFAWQGLDWGAIAGWRLLWALAALGLVGLAALPFHRFDPERVPRRSEGGERVRPAGRLARQGRRWLRVPERLAGSSRALTVVSAELALLLRERRRGWALVALALWVATLVAPLEAVRRVLLPLSWLWPVAAWATMGNREARHRTEALLFVCPRPLGRQLPAAYAAGVLLTALVGSAAAVRLAAGGVPGGLAAWGVGALFVPALALAAGVLSRGPRLFELIYLLVWYLGPVNGLPAVDFLAPVPRVQVGFLVVTGGLLAVAAALRAARLRG